MNGTQASKALGVTIQTLRRWADAGKIDYTRTKGGHRRYDLSPPKTISDGRKIIYARVSSKKQSADLERQVEFLKARYPDYEVIKEIGSGINYERPHFKGILEQLFSRDISECVISSRDRFARYGGFFEWLFKKFGAKLSVVQQDEDPDESLAADLMEVITVFSARYHGRRKYKDRKKSANIPDDESEEEV